jgi:hypothetical protein
MAVKSTIEFTVLPVLICKINIGAVIEQPGQAFPIMRKVSARYVS